MSLFLAGFALAEKPHSYLLPIIRDGKKQIRVARNFWSGEYPRPVIDVSSNVKGHTKIKAYESLREIEKTIDCEIENGLYHPWAKSNKSIVEFYQIVPNVEYTAKKDMKFSSFELKKGEKIQQEIYLSEGSCEGVLKKDKRPESRIEYECDSVKVKDLEQTAGANDKFEEQWLHLICKDGKKIFIQDAALLKQPGVKRGDIEEYGKVKAAKN